MSSRALAYTAIGLAAVLSTAGAAGAAYFGRPAATAAPVATPSPAPASAPLADEVAELSPQLGANRGTSLYQAGGRWREILYLRLPAGSWVLHADETIVNVGQPDYARCMISSDIASAPLDQQATVVGAAGGSQGQTAANLAETAAVTLRTGGTAYLFCDHDTTAGDSNLPYVDPGAVLWAHQSRSLTSTPELLP
jgi:hypothetical protein